jgi:hypothetical protein
MADETTTAEPATTTERLAAIHRSLGTVAAELEALHDQVPPRS